MVKRKSISLLFCHTTYVHVVADILATYLDFYVACHTNAKVGNMQASTDSFEPPLKAFWARRGVVGQLDKHRVLHRRRQRCHHPCITIKANVLQQY